MTKLTIETTRNAKSATEQIVVKLSQLNVDSRTDYCHREQSYLKDENILGLAESIVSEGLHNPPIVKKAGINSDGEAQYCVIAGHRRLAALRMAINRKLDAARIHPEMEVSVVLVVPEPDQDQRDFERDLLVKSVADNTNRNDLTNEERLAIVKRFRDQDIPDPRAANALGLSDTQYRRLANVVECPWMLGFVRQNHVGMSNAATLLAAAKSPAQRDLLLNGLESWIARKQLDLNQERENFKNMDRKLSGNADTIKKYLNAKIIKHWEICIEKNLPLTDETTLNFGIIVDQSKGTVEVPAVSLSIHEHDRSSLIKIVSALMQGAENSAALLKQMEFVQASKNQSADEKRRLMMEACREQAEQDRLKNEAEKGREPKDQPVIEPPGDLDTFDLSDEEGSEPSNSEGA